MQPKYGVKTECAENIYKESSYGDGVSNNRGFGRL
jgi:hypothetical protein